KRKIHRVEHEFDRHENGDDVALDEESGNATGKQDRAQHQVVMQRNHQLDLQAVTASSCCAGSALAAALRAWGRSASGCRLEKRERTGEASTTAPMMAMS